MSDRIELKPATGKWVVLAGGAVLGESNRAIELHEGELAPVLYIPRDDIAMAFLEASDAQSSCPFKGEAGYFHIEAKSGRIENAAWSYEAPKEGLEAIAGHIAFAHERVSLKQV